MSKSAETRTAVDRAVFQLRQGGLLAPGTPLPSDEPVDEVGARAYRHPLLADRRVVRLTPEAVAPGVDVEMTLLGFAAPEVTRGVAIRRGQALGFPGWALVHDRSKAKYALEVMKEFKQEAKRAPSKPGHAKDGFVAIATRLARAVPHFLPSFWEEAGRVFIDAGNTTYAAQAFEKARQAEAQYKLEVSEEARAQSFLEFALNGAIAVKSLSAYAKDLERDHDATTAYGQFYKLAVRRTLGGMAPWASLPQDLRRLAKGAGRNVDEEDERFLQEVLESPGLQRAPAEFWKQYRPALVRLSTRLPAVRGRLLNLMPRPTNVKHAFLGEWLGLLEEAGALEAAIRPAAEVTEATAPAGNAASWLGRLVNHLDDIRPYSRGDDKQELLPEALYRLARQMAPRLIADGFPVSFDDADGWATLDVDLVDLLLELKVQVAEAQHGRLRLDQWAGGAGTPGEPRPRDPVHLAADPKLGAMLVEAYEDSVGEDDFEKAIKNKKAFVEVRRRWLLERVDKLAGGGLAEVNRGLTLLGEKTGKDSFAAVPEAFQRLSALDLGEVLALTLRTGILDELGWAELEAAHAELHGDAKRQKDDSIELITQFPYLVIHNQRRVIVLGVKGQVMTHDLRIPKKHQLSGVHYLAGQLLVVLHDDDYENVAYWSSRPSELFKPKQLPQGERLVELADGSVTTGGRAIHAGDTSFSSASFILSDGERYWTLPKRSDDDDDDDDDDDEDEDGDDEAKAAAAAKPGEPAYEELEPATGLRKARSWPPFLAGWDQADTDVSASDQFLLPAPAGLTGSPLGLKGGLLGLKVRTHEEKGGSKERLEVERIDGVRWEGEPFEESVVGLLDLPGAERPRVIVELDEYDEDYNSIQGLEIREPQGGRCTALAGGDPRWCAATPVLPPRPFLHFMKPRDEKGSRVLRQVSGEQARRLLQTALEERAAAGVTAGKTKGKKSKDKTPVPMPRTDALIAGLLPASPGEPLRRAVRGLVELGAEQSEKLARFLDSRRPGGSGAADEEAAGGADAGELGDEAIAEALGPLITSSYATGKLGEQLQVASAFLSGKGAAPTGEDFPLSELEWHGWIGQTRAFAHRAVFAADLDEAGRAKLASLLELWAGTVFAEAPADLRVVKLRIADHKSPFLVFADSEDDDDEQEVAKGWAVQEGEHRYVCLYSDYYSSDDPVELWVLERGAGGKFKTPKGAEILDERKGFVPERDWLQRFVPELRTRGPRGHADLGPGAAEKMAERTGLSRPEAILLLAGMPRIEKYENDFLGKELRTLFDLKVAEAKVAKESVSSLDEKARRQLYAAAMADDPAGLWAPASEEGDAAVLALARAWSEQRGRRVAVPDEVLMALRKELSLSTGDEILLAAASQPDRPGPFHNDGEFALNSSGVLDARRDGKEIQDDVWKEVFAGDLAQSAALFMAYLAGALAVGDPLRQALPKLHQLARERLKNPKLLVYLGQWYGEGAADERKQKELFEALRGEPIQLPRPKKQDEDEEESKARASDTGSLIAVLDDGFLTAIVRPAKVKDWNDPLLVKLSRLCDEEGLFDALQFLAHPGSAAIMARIASTPVPAGGWEQNPLASVPDLVQVVSKAEGISEEAAVLYLQTLALPDPTQKNVQRWNDWKPARYAAAAAELLKKKRLVTGKRQRAGREHFLPGGWENLKAPHLPLETWKLPLLGIEREGKGGTVLRVPMAHPVLRQPPHELFAAAWKRVASGDRPAYEEVGR